jgi:hypothetical protein
MNYNEKDLEIIKHLECNMFDFVKETEIDKKEVKQEFDDSYYFMQAVANSILMTYYHEIKKLERRKNTKEKFDLSIRKIPIFKEQYTEIHKNNFNAIVALMKLNRKSNELNELIYDYYGIGIIEKQRIKDFFINETEIVTKQDLINYANEVCEYLSDYLIEPENLKYRIYYCKLKTFNSIAMIYFYFKNNWFDYIKNADLYTQLLINRNNPLIIDKINDKLTDYFLYKINYNKKFQWTLSQAGDDAIEVINKVNKLKAWQKNIEIGQ